MEGKVISKLNILLTEGAADDRIEDLEDLIIGEIEKFVKEDSFYSLPTEEIVRIIEKGRIDDAELLIELTGNMSKNKGKDSILLLNVISSETASFEECVKIISNFSEIPICKRLGYLFNCEGSLPEINYQQKIDELKNEIEELKKSTFFDFESDIHKAAENGKLSSIKYLVEQCRVNVETKDSDGRTPLYIASREGHLEVVKYLVEQCHADVEAKNVNGATPLYLASENSHLDVVKYLFEACHANVEAKLNGGFTPLHIASFNGHLEVVKYLFEECHAKITKETISTTREDKIRNYLKSKC